MFLQDDRLAADHAKAASIDAKTTLPDALMMDSIAARAAGEKPCPALQGSALPCAALPCAALPCAALPCPASPRPALRGPALPCIALPCLALQGKALPCSALRDAALLRTVLSHLENFTVLQEHCFCALCGAHWSFLLTHGLRYACPALC